MLGTTFLPIKQFDLLQQDRTTTVSTLPSSFYSVPWESAGDREQVRRGNRMVARPGRSEEIRTQEVSQQKQQAIRGKDRASPYGTMFAGHFCSLWVEPFMAIASFLSSPFVYIQHNSIRLSFTPHTHSATCVKRQAPLGASACCLCVFPSETTLCWTLDWQEVAVHSGS